MIHLHRSLAIARRPEAVFGLLTDPDRFPDVFVGIKWKLLSPRLELGARFRILTRVGPIIAGSVVRVVAWDPPWNLTWAHEAGIEQRGDFTLLPVEGRTEVHLDVAFALPGGAVGWLVERISRRIVGLHMQATLLSARRLLEFEDYAATLGGHLANRTSSRSA
jgi:uncharacterized protein YndB with AHSA1/START domain